MQTLPPIWRKPIYMNVGSSTTTNFTTTTQEYQTSQIDIPTTEYAMPSTTTDYTTGFDMTSFTQPSYETTQTTTSFTTGTMGGQPVVKVLRRGSGISPNEQQGIINCAMEIYTSKTVPLSNNTARAIKKRLKGDWIVIVYEQGKPIDFNMTCVQGNDYLYFTLDNMAYQVCRLR